MNQLPPLNRPYFRSVFSVLFFLASAPLLAVAVPPDNGCFVYPSPASGDTAWAVYRLPGSGTAQISVYNKAGDLVEQVSAWNIPGVQQTPIDLTHFRKGIYLCRVVLALDTGGTQSLKIFKFLVTR